MSAPAIRRELRFILNGEDVVLADVAPDATLLDWLRLSRALKGTKEGCAEGDCGACTVLVGKLAAGGLVYESVNACIRFMGSLDRCHVVTVEHLAGDGAKLHPVQQAMVDCHGSQCGFCTPGFVMSLYGLWMRNPDPSNAAIEKALQGNLCRCTGYEAIMRAAHAVSSYGKAGNDPLRLEREAIAARLKALDDGARVEIGSGRARLVVPAGVDDFAAVLEAEPKATVVAGSTDVGLWVTKQMRDISRSSSSAISKPCARPPTRTARWKSAPASPTARRCRRFRGMSRRSAAWWSASAASRCATWAPSAETSPTARRSATRRRR